MKNIFKNAQLNSKAKKASAALPERECNICKRAFPAKNSFVRFCRTCRLESEVYRMAEWMPQTNVSLGF